MAITADEIVNVLAGADAPLSSVAVASALKTSQTRRVVSVLTDLVREETLERVGSQYRLRDAGSHDVPGYTTSTRRTLLPTDKQAIKAGERRKAVAKLASSRKDSQHSDKTEVAELPSPPVEKKTAQKPAQEVSGLPNGTIPVDKSHENTVKPVDKPVTKLEEIEQMVDENKARDQRIRNAIERLKEKSSQKIAPVADMNFKIEILDGLGGTDADLVEIMRQIVADLRRLDALAL